MALNARDFTLPGQWAKDANTTIPPIPVSGQPYRNAALAKAIIENGQNYDNIADSAIWNQLMYLASGMALESEKYGIPRWSPLTDYAGGASLAIGTDGIPYRAVLDSGPSGAGPQDPTTTTGYWQSLGEFIGGGGGGATVEISQYPDYDNAITLPASGGQMQYTAASDGWIIVSALLGNGAGLYIYINGVYVTDNGNSVTTPASEAIIAPASKGDVITYSYQGSTSQNAAVFVPAKKVTITGSVAAADQGEVDDGLIHDKFVAPDTLKGVTDKISGFQDQAAKISISITPGTTLQYVAPADGYVQIQGSSPTSAGHINLLINGWYWMEADPQGSNDAAAGFCPVAAGDTVSIVVSATVTSIAANFFPAKKGIPTS